MDRSDIGTIWPLIWLDRPFLFLSCRCTIRTNEDKVRSGWICCKSIIHCAYKNTTMRYFWKPKDQTMVVVSFIILCSIPLNQSNERIAPSKGNLYSHVFPSLYQMNQVSPQCSRSNRNPINTEYTIPPLIQSFCFKICIPWHFGFCGDNQLIFCTGKS